MADAVTVERWLYGTLAADGALGSVVGSRIYSHVAPQGAALPCIVYQQQAARDIMGNGPGRFMSTLIYTVKTIGDTGSWSTLEAAADRVDAVLHAQAGTVAGGTVVACVREQPFSLVESVDGRAFRHLGGVYRLWVQD